MRFIKESGRENQDSVMGENQDSAMCENPTY